ncbi:MAG: hypothetical protein AAF321_03010 [Pseudomonadota bacterium]
MIPHTLQNSLLAGAVAALIGLGATSAFAAQQVTVLCKDGTTTTVGDAEDLNLACREHRGVARGRGRGQTLALNAGKVAGRGSQAQYPDDNVAKAWTAACYAEFGPDATDPDAHLLDICLSY